MTKKTITIGIPAYNEQENITRLINSILSQYIPSSISLKEIIVFSDGSTDSTIERIKSIKDKKVKLIISNARQGIAYSQNELVNRSNTDILVIINGDVLPQNKLFLSNLIMPLLKDKIAALVSADVISLPPKFFFERIISDSHGIKHSMYKRIKNEDSVFLCHGRARAFSKTFYKIIRWPKDCPEDAYSYLFCKQMGLKFVFANNAKILFRSPANFIDHKMQSDRFTLGMKVLEKDFSLSMVKEEFNIPKSLILKGFFEFIIKKPISAIGYILISAIVRFSNKKDINLSKWKVSSSSKYLLDESLNLTL